MLDLMYCIYDLKKRGGILPEKPVMILKVSVAAVRINIITANYIYFIVIVTVAGNCVLFIKAISYAWNSVFSTNVTP